MTAPDFSRRTRIVLVRPLKAGNVGATARAMKNMGLSRLVLVSPQEEDFTEAYRMAPGSHDMLDEAARVETAEEAIQGSALVVGTSVRGRKLRWPVWSPGELAKNVLDQEGDVSILFGPEDSGLDNDSLLLCQAMVTIPTDSQPSLNLSQAALLVSWAIFQEACARGYTPPARMRRSRRGKGRDNPAGPSRRETGADEVPAPVEFQGQAVQRALELLDETSYLLGRSREQVGLTLSQLLQRSSPSSREVSILLGMMAKVRYTMEHPEDEGA